MRALIIGGSTGIGAATVDAVAARGFTTREMSRTSGVDVRDRHAFADALSYEPTPHLLVYCAGVAPRPCGLLDTPMEARDETMEVHYHAAAMVLRWWASRWAGVKRYSPSAILVASTAGLRPSPEWSAYSASKAALINLGLTAAVELAPHGQRVYTVAPGRCATALRARLAPDEDPASIMQPHEVANVITGLHADTAGVLAGQVIEVARR